MTFCPSLSLPLSFSLFFVRSDFIGIHELTKSHLWRNLSYFFHSLKTSSLKQKKIATIKKMNKDQIIPLLFNWKVKACAINRRPLIFDRIRTDNTFSNQLIAKGAANALKFWTKIKWRDLNFCLKNVFRTKLLFFVALLEEYHRVTFLSSSSLSLFLIKKRKWRMTKHKTFDQKKNNNNNVTLLLFVKDRV